jgi:POLQ-like helicase
METVCKVRCGYTNPQTEVLRWLLRKGVGYHHAGLTADERTLVEDLYRTRLITVLVATSTLAAGVNLPADRVVIRSPYIAQHFLTKSRYSQMVGVECFPPGPE